MIRSIRSLIIQILALWKDLSQKQVGVRSGIDPKRVSDLLKTDLKHEVYEQLLAGVEGRPSKVALVTHMLEGLQTVEADKELTREERDAVEMGVLEASRRFREVLREAVRLSRAMPALDDYPKPHELEPARWHAGQLWPLLKDLTEDQQLAVVRVAREFQSWALMEKACDESEQAASQDLKRAGFLARLGREISEQVRGPQGWCNRVRGYAAAFAANVLRVKGDLKAAEAAFEPARRLWLAGSDPDGVLDPGKPLDLEASLLRDQRQFQQALDRLDKAIEVGRSRARCLVKKGFTYEVMGEYENAIETLLRAEPDVQKQGDPRLLYMQRLNLAVNYCHTGRYEETIELVERGREIAAELGDEIGLMRAIWLDGRVAAGLGRTQEALSLLSQARRQFAAR
ncbi:MAG TPA: tetratricopeptide repeat protein, partial [Thermoanaerobaculia bacterium]